MSKKKKKKKFDNAIFVLIGLAILVVAFGFYFKKSRETHLNEIRREQGNRPVRAQDPGHQIEPGEAANKAPSAQDHNLDPMKFEKETAEQKRRDELTMMDVRRKIQKQEQDAKKDLQRKQARVFTAKEASTRMIEIENNTKFSNAERMGHYVMLHNEIAISRTNDAEKKVMLQNIETKTKGIKMPRTIRFDIKETEKSYILKPVYGD